MLIYDLNIFANLPRNGSKRKKEKMKRTRRKIVKRKVENLKGKGKKYENEQRTFYNHWNLFGVYKQKQKQNKKTKKQKTKQNKTKQNKTNSTRKKHFTLGKKSGKVTIPLPWKYSSSAAEHRWPPYSQYSNMNNLNILLICLTILFKCIMKLT